MQIGREAKGAEGIGDSALAVVSALAERSSREAQRGRQQKRVGKSMRVIQGKKICGAVIGAAGARIGEVVEAVKGSGSAPLMRILPTEQVLFAEAVIDLDVILVVGIVTCTGGRPVVVNGRIGHCCRGVRAGVD